LRSNDLSFQLSVALLLLLIIIIILIILILILILLIIIIILIILILILILILIIIIIIIIITIITTFKVNRFKERQKIPSNLLYFDNTVTSCSKDGRANSGAVEPGSRARPRWEDCSAGESKMHPQNQKKHEKNELVHIGTKSWYQALVPSPALNANVSDSHVVVIKSTLHFRVVFVMHMCEDSPSDQHCPRELKALMIH